MPFSSRILVPLVVLVVAEGCNQNRFSTMQPPLVVPPQQPPPYVSQMEDLGRRATALDADNQDLHAQLARAQQRVQVLETHVEQLNKEVEEKATDLQELLTANQDSRQQLEAIQASRQRRGGATIKANNSLRAPLPNFSIAGVEVRRDEDVIRLELPADQVFQQGTSQLLPTARPVLDQLAETITEHYPRQLVGIEGHTDSRPLGTGSNHQLSTLQALAVLQELTSGNRLAAEQLFTVGYGANHPRASNATPAGRSKNRRIELVIYPETMRSG